MIYSVFNSNVLLIWGSNLAIIKTSLMLRLPALRTIASILMGKLLSLFLHFIKCFCFEALFNSDVEVSDCSSYIILMAF